MNVRFLKAKKVAELWKRIPDHLGLYRADGFEHLSQGGSFFEPDLEIAQDSLRKIRVEPKDLREAENCKLMYKAIPNATEYIARDQRLWVSLTHTTLIEYTRSRWPIPADDDKAIKHIKSHFFCSSARSFERDNAASRLWWMAHICNRAKGIMLDKALECLLYQSDVRAGIIERPTLSQSQEVFSEVIRTLRKSYEGDKELFDRAHFRSFMKNLSLEQGLFLLSALPLTDLKSTVSRCAAI